MKAILQKSLQIFLHEFLRIIHVIKWEYSKNLFRIVLGDCPEMILDVNSQFFRELKPFAIQGILLAIFVIICSMIIASVFSPM